MSNSAHLKPANGDGAAQPELPTGWIDVQTVGVQRVASPAGPRVAFDVVTVCAVLRFQMTPAAAAQLAQRAGMLAKGIIPP